MRTSYVMIEKRHNVTKGAKRTMKRTITLAIGALALAMVFAAPAMAQETIQVDAQNGSDFTCERDGGGLDTNSTCESITRALEIAEDGDTIQVSATGPYDDSIENFPIVIDKEVTLEGGGGLGGLGLGTVFAAQFGNRPVIEADLSAMGNPSIDLDGNGTDDIFAENRQPVIWVHDADNVTIDSFVIRDSSPNSSPPDAPRGIYITVDSDSNNGSSDNFTLQNSLIEDLTSGNNRARGLGFNVEEDPTTSGDTPDGSEDRANNPLIDNNTFRSISSDNDRVIGMSFNGDIVGAQITNNSISDLSSNGTTGDDQVKAISLTEDAASPKIGPNDFTIENNLIDDLNDDTSDAVESALFIGGYENLGDNNVHQNSFRDGAVDRCCGGTNLDVLNAINNWWGDASGPSTSDDTGTPPDGTGKLGVDEFATDPNTGELADNNGQPIVKRSGAPANVRFDPFLNNDPNAGADGGLGDGDGGLGDGDGDGDISQFVFECNGAVAGVDIEVIVGDNEAPGSDDAGTDPDVLIFASLRCDDLFGNGGGTTFNIPENRQFSPGEVEQINIQYFARKDGATDGTFDQMFQTGILFGDDLLENISYIFNTNSDDADIAADLNEDDTIDGADAGEYTGGTDALDFDEAIGDQNKRAVLTFSTGGSVGGLSADETSTAPQASEPTVQPLSVSNVQTSQLGPNYTFSVQGQGVASTSLQVFDLSGRSVANETSSGSTLRFRPMASNGAPLANGIYLYQVTVRGHDGTVKSMGVRKMLVLR